MTLKKYRNLTIAIIAIFTFFLLIKLVDLRLPLERKSYLLDPGEESPGGSTTNTVIFDKTVFQQPSSILDFETKGDFFLGKALFDRPWVASPSSTKSADGLGPLFNARSCASCHINGGRGHLPNIENLNDSAVSLVLRLSQHEDYSTPPANNNGSHKANSKYNVYGHQLQDLAVPGIKPEGKIKITYTTKIEEFPDGTKVALSRPHYKITELAYGPISEQLAISPRIASPMIGLGLLEAISEEDIIRRSRGVMFTDKFKNNIKVKGKAHFVKDIETSKKALGRFGWKATQPTLNQQNQNAFNSDIGLSTTLFTNEAGDCTPLQTDCLSSPHGESSVHGGLEVSDEMSQMVLLYTRHLAPPLRKSANRNKTLSGKKLFYDTGCESCHRASYTTGHTHPDTSLRGQKIFPYTDLLLHDMGEDLSEKSIVGQALGNEWRTPPLWGIGYTKQVSGSIHLLHDGRARAIEEAILWHGGSASFSKNLYKNLPKKDRKALLDFVESL